MGSPDTMLSALWLIWLLSWLIAAAWSDRTQTRQSGLAQLWHGVFMWAGALLLFAHPDALGSLLRPLYPRGAAIEWTALALVVVGLGWTWWARIHLGRLWSGAVTLKEGHRLIRTGPYRVTRHPIYTGLLLALFATALLQDSVAAAIGLLLFAVGLLLKIQQEEQLLSGVFGAQYADYRAHVPALVPTPW